jgi:hypothetical protein
VKQKRLDVSIFILSPIIQCGKVVSNGGNGSNEKDEKEYSHPIQLLRIDHGRAGLYPEPRVWMDGKDVAGFNEPMNKFS